MTDFASQTNHVRELTDEEVRVGFANCSGYGLTLNSLNVNSALRLLSTKLDTYSNQLQEQIDNRATHNDLSGAIAVEAQLRNSAIASVNDVLDFLAERITQFEEQSVPYIPVGGIFETTIDYSSGSELVEDIGYGTWQRFGEGVVTVGKSTKQADPLWTKLIENVYGEFEHTLTEEELASHTHSSYARQRSIDGSSNEGDYTLLLNIQNGLDGLIEETGGNEPHNNTQPSVVVGRWVRTA